MKIHFNKDIAYQLDAINSVVDLFKGANSYSSPFSVVKSKKAGTLFGKTDTGFGNNLVISDNRMLENLQKVQIENGLGLSEGLKKTDLQYSIEMETGTGKTYVYLRTIYELNKTYGFTKFIIVVPSVAIREGVKSTLRQTQEHFSVEYDNVVARHFVYNSKQISEIRSFAVNTNIEIMIINIDAFNSEDNIINKPHYETSGIPLDLIKNVRPIVIMDEPQMMNSDTAQKSINSFNPLCVLRYSATHIQKLNLVYRFSAYDAYEQGYVKQIAVAGMQAENDHTDVFIRFYNYDPKKRDIWLDIDVQNVNLSIDRKTVKCNIGDNLEDLTKREIYKNGFTIDEVRKIDNRWQIVFQNNTTIFLGDNIGGISRDTYQRIQIRKTITEHLNKELELAGRDKKVKVLSLFFIDRVSNFRSYDEEGTIIEGKHARWFDEEYNNLIQLDKYRILFDLPSHQIQDKDKIRNGYFSQDKGRFIDTTGGTTKDDSIYELIMTKKEELLNPNNPLRFIFSHSALGVGWDNPNVFQICTLNESKSEIKRRQSIGRGLRICVDEDGDRIYDRNINTLTVIANETYEEFVENLQKDIEEETGIPFGTFEELFFADIIINKNDPDPTVEPILVGDEKSKEIFKWLTDQKLIITKKVQPKNTKGPKNKITVGKPTDILIYKIQQKEDLGLPIALEPFIKPIIEKLLSVLPKKSIIKNKDDEKNLSINKQVILSPEFIELWNKIKHKTIYEVKFDSDELTKSVIETINNRIKKSGAKIIYQKATVKQKLSGLESQKIYTEVIEVEDSAKYFPDVITFLQNETQLTRKTIINILKEVDLECLRINPQLFMEEVVQIIKEVKLEFLIKGIEYRKLDNQEFYVQELFEPVNPIKGYLTSNLIESKKSPYDYVKYDSNIESELAQAFEKSDNVKVFAKLPAGFQIPTPLGTYNPDWAILWDKDGNQKLYFVLESKGSTSKNNRRNFENHKIECGKKHFNAIDSTVTYDVIAKLDDMNKLI